MFKYDYLQSKLHGIHSKSIFGEKFKRLKKISSIENLKKEIFPDQNFDIPSYKLFTYLEKQYKRKIFDQIIYTAKYFNFKNKFINILILKYELENVKQILMSYYNRNMKIDELFEVNMYYSINYNEVYRSDLTIIKSLVNIFSDTIFDFIIPLLQAEIPLYELENVLDKFYYELLIESVKHLNSYEKRNILEIVIEEMNLQNIIWAFRLKNYYKKTFKNVKSTFLIHEKLISIDKLEKIFDEQFITDDPHKCIIGIPIKYCRIVKKAIDEFGNLDIAKLEDISSARIMRKYIKFFYTENFNILPIVSFIYIKKVEYLNIVRLIESLRYNINPEII